MEQSGKAMSSCTEFSSLIALVCSKVVNSEEGADLLVRGLGPGSSLASVSLSADTGGLDDEPWSPFKLQAEEFLARDSKCRSTEGSGF